MHGQPHLERRGQVYQWRRKIGTISTKFVQVRLSLLTTDRAVAVKLARRITASSECIVQELLEDRITKEEATRFLAATIRREKVKIETLSLFQRVDSLDPQDDALHDEAQREAWKFISTRGLNAAVPADITRDPEKALLASRIALLRADLRSPARQARIRDDFCDFTGRTELSAVAFLRALDLHIVGKSAAWNSENDTRQEIENLAAELAAEPVSIFGASRSETSLRLDETACDNTRAEAAFIRPSERSENAGKGPCLVDAPHSPNVPASTQRPDEGQLHDPRIDAVVQRMNAQKRKEEIEEKTLRQYESCVRLFTMITGVDDIRDVRQGHATAFRAALHEIPKAWGKSPADRTMSYEDILQKAKGLPGDKVGLSIPTINRHLEHLDQIVKWADDEGIPVGPKLSPAKLRRKDKRRDRDKKVAFKEAELRDLFNSPVWTGSKSERFQTTPGSNIFKNGVYWCPVICAYSGGRLEEIAGLAVNDIQEEDGISFFEFKFTEVRRLKNISSIRQVPVHDRLIELGFLDFVKTARSTGQVDLFPGLRQPKSGKHGRKVGRRMRDIVDKVMGNAGSAYSLQSMRHYVQGLLDNDVNVPDKVCRDIIGHEGKDTHERVYGDRSPLVDLKAAINRLPIVF